jgi:hypothetical protein
MRQRMGSGAAVRITSAAGTHGGFDRTGEATIGIDILAANHHVAARTAASHGSSEVNLDSVFHRSRRTGGQLRFVDRWRRR